MEGKPRSRFLPFRFLGNAHFVLDDVGHVLDGRYVAR